MPLKQNLHGFIETYRPKLAVRSDVSLTPAYLKGVLEGVWDVAEQKVQNARKNYFALAAIAFAGDVYFFGGSTHMARLALTVTEIATMAVLGTKIYGTEQNGQHMDETSFIPDPDAREDKAVYGRAQQQLKSQMPSVQL